MADTPISKETPLTGTTAATILAAPAAATQRVVAKGDAGVYNRDTVNHDITFQKNVGGTLTILQKFTGVAPGSLVTLAKKVNLCATNASLEAFTDATATTTEPVADVAALETT